MIRIIDRAIEIDRKEAITETNLLYLFWQRKSDACPLPAEIAEKEEKDFQRWVSDQRIYNNKEIIKAFLDTLDQGNILDSASLSVVRKHI